MSTQQLIRGWGEHCRRALTERTQLHYGMVLRRFADFAPRKAKNIGLEHLERYLDSILKNFTRRTCNAHLTALKSFFRWASENYSFDNLAKKIKMLREDPPRRRFISEEEYEKLLSACQDGEAKIIKFLASTGLRAAELQSLQLDNFSHDLKFLRFAGKGRKERVVPLNETARSCVTENGKPHLDLLKNYRNKNALYALCKRLSRKAGIPIAGPHSLRRFFATSLLKKGKKEGVSIYFVSKCLGHADVKTTEMYLQCSTDDLEGVTDVLDY